nr:hypothetical protein B0A51_07441 [Rachicladosporium sp. CCFEE 5018]
MAPHAPDVTQNTLEQTRVQRPHNPVDGNGDANTSHQDAATVHDVASSLDARANVSRNMAAVAAPGANALQSVPSPAGASTVPAGAHANIAPPAQHIATGHANSAVAGPAPLSLRSNQMPRGLSFDEQSAFMKALGANPRVVKADSTAESLWEWYNDAKKVEVAPADAEATQTPEGKKQKPAWTGPTVTIPVQGGGTVTQKLELEFTEILKKAPVKEKQVKNQAAFGFAKGRGNDLRTDEETIDGDRSIVLIIDYARDKARQGFTKTGLRKLKQFDQRDNVFATQHAPSGQPAIVRDAKTGECYYLAYGNAIALWGTDGGMTDSVGEGKKKTWCGWTRQPLHVIKTPQPAKLQADNKLLLNNLHPDLFRPFEDTRSTQGGPRDFEMPATRRKREERQSVAETEEDSDGATPRKRSKRGAKLDAEDDSPSTAPRKVKKRSAKAGSEDNAPAGKSRMGKKSSAKTGSEDEAPSAQPRKRKAGRSSILEPPVESAAEEAQDADSGHAESDDDDADKKPEIDYPASENENDEGAKVKDEAED